MEDSGERLVVDEDDVVVGWAATQNEEPVSLGLVAEPLVSNSDEASPVVASGRRRRCGPATLRDLAVAEADVDPRRVLKPKKAKKEIVWSRASQQRQSSGSAVSFGSSFFGIERAKEAVKPKPRRKRLAPLAAELESIRARRVVAAKLASGEYPLAKRGRIDDPRPDEFVDVTLLDRRSRVALAFDHTNSRPVVVVLPDKPLLAADLRIYDPLCLPLPPAVDAPVNHLLLDTGLFEPYSDELPTLARPPPDCPANLAVVATAAARGTRRAAIFAALCGSVDQVDLVLARPNPSRRSLPKRR